jgi:nucleoid-associated protein YgaU
MVVPSFDVVLIEPSGEGVLAGRAAPGWTVELDNGGIKIAEATADRQGEWNIILDKKLAPGDYRLQLRTISPDGTRALTSQQTVPVAVGNAKEQTAPAGIGSAAGVTPEGTKARRPAEALPQQQTSPQATASVAQPEGAKPVVTFNTVDYLDTGADGGRMKLSGTSAPGAAVQLYFDGKPFATAKADAVGVWKAESDMKLGEGAHSLKAVPAGAGGAADEAVIAIERRPAVAKPPEPAPAPPQVAAAEDADETSAAANAQGAGPPDIYEVRRGDTLWDIAKRYLGSGFRYTSIFQGNRETIKNPNLILPAQKVKMPPS